MRYVQHPETLELIPAHLYQPPSKPGLQIMTDSHYDGLRATNGTDISTRAKHRQYMKDNGLTTIDDFSSIQKPKTPDSVKEDVIRALRELRHGNRPRYEHDITRRTGGFD